MVERWRYFFQVTLDAAWLTELFLMALSWVVVCHGFQWKKGCWLKWLGQVVCLYAVLMVTDIALMVIPPKFVRVLWSLAHGAIALVYMRLCSHYRRNTNIILWCSMYAGVCALCVIAGQFSFLTGEFIASGALEGIVRCLVYLLMPILAVFLCRFNFDDFQTVPRSGMSLIIIGDISLLALYVVESLWAGMDYRVTVTLAGAYICILTMVIFAINAMYTMCAEQSEIISLQAEKQRLLAEQESMKMMESSLEDLRCIRHDLKNQYAYMQILLQSQRYEELDTYFQQVAENLPPQLNYIDCGNRSMNTILNMEISKAKGENIRVTHQLVVPPVLPFSEDDLCAIVVNLMDNAIEECRRLNAATGETESIHLEIYPQKSYLFIMCRNATHLRKLERRGWGLQTTKDDGKLHGYGTRIVSKTAEKYNGCAEFSLENGCFVAKVMLDMMEGAKNADQNCTVR